MFSHALDEENVKLSKYKLLKYVNLKTSYNIDIVCENCCNYIGRQNSLPSSVQCSECKTSINTTKTKSYFVTLNMEEQIKSFVEKKTISVGFHSELVPIIFLQLFIKNVVLSFTKI